MIGVVALAVFTFFGREGSVHGVLHIKHVLSIGFLFLFYNPIHFVCWSLGDSGDGDYIRKCSFSSPHNSAGIMMKIWLLGATNFLLS